MPLIKPFKGITYNKSRIKDVAKVVAPPYDIISPKMQDELYKKDKNNIVRLILGKTKKTDDGKGNRYTRAKDFFETWLKKGILIEDNDEAIYVYSQEYRYGNKWVEHTGFISLMKLDLEGKKTVLPHENTLKAPKADRLNLMRNVAANLSPIFMLYEDNSHSVKELLGKGRKNERPFIDITIDGVRNRVWRLTERSTIREIEKLMADKDTFIADGHHRYETAVNYALEIENSPTSQSLKDNSKLLMAYFCELDDDSLTILPTHRLIKNAGTIKEKEMLENLKKFFVIERASSAKDLLTRLRSLKNYHTFGIYLGKKSFFVIRLKKEEMARAYMGSGSKSWKNLDVAILHLFVIQNILKIRDEENNIEFVKDAQEAFDSTASGKYKIAFLLNPTKVSQVKEIARNGEKMPRKATYFYPKPLSGLVIRKM